MEAIQQIDSQTVVIAKPYNVSGLKKVGDFGDENLQPPLHLV